MGEKNRNEPSRQQGSGYSWQVGSVYVFNLMLGAGLLALPKAFVEVGWILGLVGLGVLAFISYCTVTFVIEAQSVHNALLLHNSKAKKGNKVVPNGDEELELENTVVENNEAVRYVQQENHRVAVDNQNGVLDTYTEEDVNHVDKADEKPETGESELENDVYLYEITTKTELGELCQVFFHRIGFILYYIAICLYLYGGLSIYSAAIAKSLTSVVCGDSDCFDGNDTAPCKNVTSLSVIHMYRIMLAAFVVLCGPFIFFTLTKTKILQLSTMAFRWFALISMIILALIKIIQGEGISMPNLVVVKKLPNFFGVALYAFMCQYSIPAVVTPIINKNRLKLSMMLNFACVVLFYAFILLTAVYAFQADKVHDLYTLNFTHPAFFKYMLELFPVFTLSANFPILGIVLRENLKTLFLRKGEGEYGIFLRRILFPLVVLTPPIIIAYSTYNVGMLVGYTGAYAGAIIQYVVPAMLIYCARKKAITVFGEYDNKYQSPFRHRIWIYLVLIWYVVCFVFVTYYKATV